MCIDHFNLFATQAGKECRKKILHSPYLASRPFGVIENFSVPGLMTLLEEAIKGGTVGFDWLYIDGSCRAGNTLLDAGFAWRLANKGAIIIPSRSNSMGADCRGRGGPLTSARKARSQNFHFRPDWYTGGETICPD